MRLTILILAMVTSHLAKAEYINKLDTANRGNSIKKFNIDSFKKNKQLKIHTHSLADGTKIYADTEYYENLSKSRSPYRIFNEYYSNLVLKSTEKTFYDIRYGKYYEYDENGKLIKEIDEDLPYKFTIEDLVHKMLMDFKIDLRIVKSGVRIRRYVHRDTKLPKYEINQHLSGTSKYRIITLDGKTGKVLSDHIVESVDD